VHGPIVLNQDCGVDLEAQGVPTIAIIGPSRKGKSVLAGLLAGGDPKLFPQSHSSFQAMTSGTQIVEVPDLLPGVSVRIVDTEGLSHVGRSRSKREAIVRQFLVSTYLTSSWILWLDSEVLSTSFFTMMWLVHDYVIDVLKVKDAAGDRLPRMMYIRTQETEVQQREYVGQFADFASFFEAAMQGHEDGDILRSMFAPDGVHGHALPIWTLQDLEAFEQQTFWSESHDTPFKAAVAQLRERLLNEAIVSPSSSSSSRSVPPLLPSLAALEQHLPRIARLESFDPRDHEAAKISRLRQQLRAKYGRVAAAPGTVGFAGGQVASVPDLLNIFDPDDRDVRKWHGRIDQVVAGRLQEHCRQMRLEYDVAIRDPEVEAVLARFSSVADAFSAALELFADEAGPLSEREILRGAVEHWGLDPDITAKALASKVQSTEAAFLEKSGFTAAEMKRLNLHEKIRWRIEECVMRLRGKVATEMLIIEDDGAEGEEAISTTERTSPVWRLGEWRWQLAKKDGKTRASRVGPIPREYAVCVDPNGSGVHLLEERAKTKKDGARITAGFPVLHCDGAKVAAPQPTSK